MFSYKFSGPCSKYFTLICFFSKMFSLLKEVPMSSKFWFFVLIGSFSLISKACANDFAYVANQFEDNISVIDISTNTVTDTVSVGSFPNDIAITPDSDFAYVANSVSDNVSVIDTSTNTVIDTVTVGSEPFAIAITPDGDFAYVVNTSSDNVSVIDINIPLIF